MESYQRTERNKLKQRLREKHFLTEDIAQYIGLILNGPEKVKIKELWDRFPELFETEKAEAEKIRKEQELAEYKAKFIDFAHRHNRARSGGGT